MSCSRHLMKIVFSLKKTTSFTANNPGQETLFQEKITITAIVLG